MGSFARRLSLCSHHLQRAGSETGGKIRALAVLPGAAPVASTRAEMVSTLRASMVAETPFPRCRVWSLSLSHFGTSRCRRSVNSRTSFAVREDARMCWGSRWLGARAVLVKRGAQTQVCASGKRYGMFCFHERYWYIKWMVLLNHGEIYSEQ